MKKTICILLIVFMALSFAGCKKKDPADDKNTLADSSQNIPVDNPVSNSTNRIEELNFSSLLEKDYVLDYVTAVSSDLALIWGHEGTNFPVPDQYFLYVYRFSTKELQNTGVTGLADIGNLSIQPVGGFVSAILVNSEYVPDRIMLFDTDTAEVSYITLDTPMNFWCLAVSPDKSKIAYTTEDGVYLCDGQFKNPRLVLERYNDPINKTGDELPKSLSFIDNNQILYLVSGYEWTSGGGIYNVKTDENIYTKALSESAFQALADGRVFYSTNYTILPAGFVDITSSSQPLNEILPITLVPGADSKDDDVWASVNGVSISPSGNYAAFYGIINMVDGSQRMAARVYDMKTGEIKDSYDRVLDHEYRAFTNASFLKDDQVLLETCYIVDQGMQAILWNINQ